MQHNSNYRHDRLLYHKRLHKCGCSSVKSGLHAYDPNLTVSATNFEFGITHEVLESRSPPVNNQNLLVLAATWFAHAHYIPEGPKHIAIAVRGTAKTPSSPN